jgi:hypothetical protein
MHVMRHDATDTDGWELWVCPAESCGRRILLNGRFVPVGYQVLIQGDPHHSHVGGKSGHPQLMGLRAEPTPTWTDADVTEMAMLGIALPME